MFLQELDRRAGEIDSHAQTQIIDGAKLAFAAFDAAAQGPAGAKPQSPG
jgi:hypothetical protein